MSRSRSQNAAENPWIVALLYFAIVAYCAIDTIQTAILLDLGVMEGNPVVATIIAYWGWKYVIAIKVVLILALGGLLAKYFAGKKNCLKQTIYKENSKPNHSQNRIARLVEIIFFIKWLQVNPGIEA